MKASSPSPSSPSPSIDDDYFSSSTYRPLSNLPTPPPSNHASAVNSPQPGHGPALDEALRGPAIHLANLLPPAASLATPSVPLVHGILARARLPLDTVALAVCLLDSLDSRFARAWRRTCPLSPGHASGQAPGQAASPPAKSAPARPHAIDAVRPEVIVLAALVLAAKFTDDGSAGQQSAHAYCTAWGAAPRVCDTDTADIVPADTPPWTAAQLVATERCIMQNLEYRILPLLDADLLADARADMQRAGQPVRRWRGAVEEEPCGGGGGSGCPTSL